MWEPLIRQTLPDPDGDGSPTAPVTTFSYDASGNRSSLTDPVGNIDRRLICGDLRR